jgi:hypothetical protein
LPSNDASSLRSTRSVFVLLGRYGVEGGMKLVPALIDDAHAVFEKVWAAVGIDGALIL